MTVTIVKICVKAGFEREFEAATIDNHTNTLREPGNYRFDVLKSKTEPGVYYLYEAFGDQAAVEAHKRTAHYARWRETVEPWMACPRSAAPCEALAPADAGMWSAVHI